MQTPLTLHGNEATIQPTKRQCLNIHLKHKQIEARDVYLRLLGLCEWGECLDEWVFVFELWQQV